MRISDLNLVARGKEGSIRGKSLKPGETRNITFTLVPQLTVGSPTVEQDWRKWRDRYPKGVALMIQTSKVPTPYLLQYHLPVIYSGKAYVSSCANGIKDGIEDQIDCNGVCHPCEDCFADAWPGNGDAAKYFSFKSQAVKDAAQDALYEYRIFNQKRDISLSSRRSGAQFSTGGRTISAGNLSLAPKALSLVRRTASGSVEGDSVRRIVADPLVQIGSSVSRSRVGSFQMEMKLPPDAKRVVYTSLAPTSRTIEGGRAVYRWDYKDTYPVRVFVLYQTTPYELAATKRIVSRNGRTIAVEVAVKNLGPTAVQNVRVLDDFAPFSGRPAPGEGFFSESSSAQSESRLIYNRTISSIPANGTAVVTYKLVLTSDQVSLRPSRVYVGDALIVMSNRLDE